MATWVKVAGISVRLLALLLVPVAAHADTFVSLLPAAQTVSVGDLLTLEIWSPAAADTFNGFGGAITYDSTLVEPVTGWLGPYIINACGTYFSDRHWHTGVASFSVSTLCGYQMPGSNLTGPGLLYTLQFRAIGAGEWTPVWVAVVPAPYVQDPLHSGRRYRTGYLHGGPYVLPCITAAATVTITTPVGVEPALVARPDDGRVYDVQGRRVDPAVERSGVVFGQRKKARVK